MRITNPYENVNWDTVNHFKAGLHNHNTMEAPNYDWTVEEQIDAYHARGYKINCAGFRSYPWTDFDRDPEQLGMLAVQGGEFKGPGHHLLNLFNTYDNNDEWGGNPEVYPHRHEFLREIVKVDGISYFTHPGRYFGIFHHTDQWDDVVQFYKDYYEMYDPRHLLGQEVYSKGLLPQFPSRTIWFKLLNIFMPHRPIWGLSNDDARRLSEFGGNWNVLLMDDLTEEDAKQSLRSGAYYFSTDITKETIAPTIRSIEVDDTGITIDAENYTRIMWLWNDRVIQTGERFVLEDAHPGANYVVAKLESGGYNYKKRLTFTNPFGIIR